MPTYGYRCSRGHRFEVLQRITDAPANACPQCGAPATRVFYPVGIIFKGQGFYKTDSRGSDAAVSPASNSETKSEVKPPETKASETKPPETKASDAGADSKS